MARCIKCGAWFKDGTSCATCGSVPPIVASRKRSHTNYLSGQSAASSSTASPAVPVPSSSSSSPSSPLPSSSSSSPRVQKRTRRVPAESSNYILLHTLGGNQFEPLSGDGAYSEWLQKAFTSYPINQRGCVFSKRLEYVGNPEAADTIM